MRKPTNKPKRPTAPNRVEIERMVNQIVTRLFRVAKEKGGYIKGDRLAVKAGAWPDEKEIGGICREAAAQEIREVLAERDQRLMLAEEILCDLATGYWVSVLDDNDDPVKEKMGQRVLNYWRMWNKGK